MGWWGQDSEGRSLQEGTELVWGDGPADTLDEALAEIDKQFVSAWGRVPTVEELTAGLLFSTSIREE